MVLYLILGYTLSDTVFKGVQGQMSLGLISRNILKSLELLVTLMVGFGGYYLIITHFLWDISCLLYQTRMILHGVGMRYSRLYEVVWLSHMISYTIFSFVMYAFVLYFVHHCEKSHLFLKHCGLGRIHISIYFAVQYIPIYSKISMDIFFRKL